MAASAPRTCATSPPCCSRPTGRWDRADIDRAVETGRNQTTPLAHPVPVYIAYFTAAATSDGDIVTYNDVYGRDAPVRAGAEPSGESRASQQQASAAN